MTAHHSRRWTHLMRAEISRRRALAGLTGGAALGFAGRGPRTAARQPSVLLKPLDLARAALQPVDVPDGADLVGTGGITYDGLSGAFESGAVFEIVATALDGAGVLESLVSGHVSTLGKAFPRYKTDVFQFASATAARTALEALAGMYGGLGLTEVTPEGERARFFHQVADPRKEGLLLFRSMELVVVLLSQSESAEPLTDDEMIAHLDGLREAVNDRVQEITAADHDGLGLTTPTPALFSARAGATVPVGRGWRLDGYTWLGGTRVAQVHATTAGLPPLDMDDDGIEEAVARQEEVRTLEGGQVLLGVRAYRFVDNDAAARFFDRLADGESSDPAVEILPIEPPAMPAGLPDSADALETRWTEQRFTSNGKDLYGVTGWGRGEGRREIVGVQFAALPTGGVSPDVTDALVAFGWIGLALHALTANLDDLSEEEIDTGWLALYAFWPELCPRMAFVGLLD